MNLTTVRNYLPYLPEATCPHCLGRKMTCHVCDGAGRLNCMGKVASAAGNAWAKPGCPCRACELIGS